MRIPIAILVLGIVLFGCSPASSGTGGSAYPVESNPYPVDGNAYPGEQPVLPSISPFPANIPTPLPSKGTIVGRLVSATPDQPLTGLPVYLATILPLTPGPDHMVTLDMANSPHDTVREDGRFIIQDVSPDDYVLMFWAPHQSTYASDPTDSSREFVVHVVAGETVDVGTLSISPPR